MKRLFKAMATTAVTLMAIQANAIQVTYSFRVNSSGPSIYPCNAGLMTHDPHEGDKVACYTAITHEKCSGDCVGLDCEGGDEEKDPKPHSNLPEFLSWSRGGGHPGGGHPGGDKEDDKNNCVCTTSKGRKNGNYFHANYRPWGDTVDPHADVVSGESPYFNQLFDEKTAYHKVLEKLSFNLGSELYNAKYFVDICYRGSQIDYSHFETKWNLLAEASVTDYGLKVNGDGYSDLSDLKMKAYIICSTQERSCRDGECSDKDDELKYDLPMFNDKFLQYLNPYNADYEYESDTYPATSSSFKKIIDKQYKELDYKGGAAKFCKIRYVFEETDGLDKKYAKHRKWQKHGADICTHTKVEMAKLENGCKDCK